jgi:hypothetical protein
VNYLQPNLGNSSAIFELQKNLAGSEFFVDLLKMLIERGFGVLPARETAISILELLLRHHSVWKETPPSDYELGRLLRISPRKLRGYFDEINFRNPMINEQVLQIRLADVLKQAERIAEKGSWVVFEIEDGLLRAYAKQLVRSNFGVFESGLSGSVVKLSGKQYAALCLSVLPETKTNELLASLSTPDSKSQKDEGKSLAAKTLEAFCTAAGSQAGKKLVDLGFAVITCGFSELSSISKAINELIER